MDGETEFALFRSSLERAACSLRVLPSSGS